MFTPIQSINENQILIIVGEKQPKNYFNNSPSIKILEFSIYLKLYL